MAKEEPQFISLKEASKLTPYGADYLSLLVRKGKLEGWKIEGKWHTTKEEIKKYLQKTAESSYEHQQNLNVKIPADEIRKAKINVKWGILLASVILFFGILIWKIVDDNNNADIRLKYRISEDREGNLTIFANDPSLIKSVKVMQK